jgi:hypothetical protein
MRCTTMRGVLLLAALLATTARAELPVAQLAAGVHLIRAEVADTLAARMRGLMHRRSLGENEGMLFVFEEAGIQCMWMKNTLIPLAVAFLDERGRVINVAEMKPHDETSHCAERPARYALEMNRGWFSERGIKPGFAIRGLERAREPGARRSK